MVSIAAVRNSAASPSPSSRARVSVATVRRRRRPCESTISQSAQMLLMGPSSWKIRPSRCGRTSGGTGTGGTCPSVRVKTICSSSSMITASASHIRRVNRAALRTQESPSAAHSLAISTETARRWPLCVPWRVRCRRPSSLVSIAAALGHLLQVPVGNHADENHGAHDGEIQGTGNAQQIDKILQNLQERRPNHDPQDRSFSAVQ